LPLKFFDSVGSTIDVGDLDPNEIIYLWLEKEIEKGVSNFDNNDCVLNIKYKVVK